MDAYISGGRNGGGTRLFLRIVAIVVFSFLFLAGCGKEDNPAGRGNDGGIGGDLILPDGDAWTMVNEKGEIACLVFRQNGEWSIAVTRNGDWRAGVFGTWSVIGKSLTINPFREDTKTFTYSISGNVLTLILSNGEAASYTRMSGINPPLPE
jgi:hypothetical protein